MGFCIVVRGCCHLFMRRCSTPFTVMAVGIVVAVVDTVIVRVIGVVLRC